MIKGCADIQQMKNDLLIRETELNYIKTQICTHFDEVTYLKHRLDRIQKIHLELQTKLVDTIDLGNVN